MKATLEIKSLQLTNVNKWYIEYEFTYIEKDPIANAYNTFKGNYNTDILISKINGMTVQQYQEFIQGDSYYSNRTCFDLQAKCDAAIAKLKLAYPVDTVVDPVTRKPMSEASQGDAGSSSGSGSSSGGSSSGGTTTIINGIEEWKASKAYTMNTLVTHSSSLFICLKAHTSSDFTNDLGAGDWKQIDTDKIQTAWSTKKAYAVNDMVVYNGDLYICTKAHTSSTFASDLAANDWKKASATKTIPMVWAASTKYVINDIIVNNNNLYLCLANHTSSTDFTKDTANWELINTPSGISTWGTSIKYAVNDIVLQDSKLYLCTINHTSTTFSADAKNWKLLNADCKVHTLELNTTYNSNDIVTYNGDIYLSKVAFTSSTTDVTTDLDKLILVNTHFAWVTNHNYQMNDMVLYNNDLYICITNHKSTTFAADITNWKQLSIYGQTITLWVSNYKYQINDMIISNGMLYRCSTAHTSTTDFNKDISNWNVLSIYGMPITQWITKKEYQINDIVFYNSQLFVCIVKHTSDVFANDLSTNNWKLIEGNKEIKTWATNTTYKSGDLLLYNYNIYLCTDFHTSTTFAADNKYWEKLLDSSDNLNIKAWVTKTDYSTNDLIVYNNKLYICIKAHTSTVFNDDMLTNKCWSKVEYEQLIVPWTSGKAYVVNDMVFYANRLYQCTTAHTASPVMTTDISAGYWKKILYDNDNINVLSWSAGTDYIPNNIVAYNGNVYMCIIKHTSTTFSNNMSQGYWKIINFNSTFDAWAKETKYVANTIVLFNNSLYICMKDNTSCTTVFDDDYKAGYWQKLGGESSGVSNWTVGHKYAINDMINKNNEVYLCIASHTAANFDTDSKYWKRIDTDMTVTGSDSGYAQITKLNITAPKTLTLTINNTTTFCLPPVEILKFKAGEKNVVVTECAFNNSDSTDFEDNQYVSFDGTMHPKTVYDISMSIPQEITDGTNKYYISKSDTIDFTKFKSVTDVTVL